jgi:DNA-binding CsgD family transcriptional regulator
LRGAHEGGGIGAGGPDRAFGLSARESELLSHLGTGADTRELARRMFLSEHTVQDHLKSIFAKTSAHNRRTLLSRALG